MQLRSQLYRIKCVVRHWLVLNSRSFSRDSSVSIATRYGLDGQGIESRWGQDFPHPSRPALGPTQNPTQRVPGISRGVKRPRRGVDHPHPSSSEVKERVELYFYFPCGFSWPVLGWTLPLLYLLPASFRSKQGIDPSARWHIIFST